MRKRHPRHDSNPVRCCRRAAVMGRLSVALIALALLAPRIGFSADLDLSGEWRITHPVKSAERPSAESPEVSALLPANVSTAAWEPIQVPTNWHHRFPDSYPDPRKANDMYQFTERKSTYVSAVYARSFTAPAMTVGQRCYLRFGAVGWETQVWVNGAKAGAHRGSFTPFELDITAFVQPGKENHLRLWVCNDFGENPPRHSYGKMFFASANVGGIVGPVSLVTRPPVHLRRVLINPRNDGRVDLALHSRNHGGRVVTASLRLVLRPHCRGEGQPALTLPAGTLQILPGETEMSAGFRIEKPRWWGPAHPWLYDLEIQLFDAAGALLDSHAERFGFREFTIQGDKFFLNGERFRLYGGNILTAGGWEQFDPAGPFRQELRRQRQQGANAIRYHMGGADSTRLLALADEEGMLVLSELPMFHRVFNELPFTGDARRTFMENVGYEWKERVLRDHNHPSCVAWSLANEVWTDSTVDELSELHALVKPLDRQGRPMSACSGIHSFGIPTLPVRTDFWDAHLYNLMSQMPWTLAADDFDRYFSDLQKIYGRLDRPAISFECLDLGTGKPKTVVPLVQELTPEEYLVMAGTYAKTLQPKFSGLRPFLAWEQEGKALLDDLCKSAVEQFRLETRFQGFHPWWHNRKALPPAYAGLTGPTFVGIEPPLGHAIAGAPLPFTASIVKDSLSERRVSLRLSLVSGTRVLVETAPQAASLPAEVDKTRVGCSLALPGELATGVYQLRLVLEEGGKALNTNQYGLFVLNRRDLPALTATGKLACFGSAAALPGLLKRQGVAFTQIPAPEQLAAYSRLLLCPANEAEWRQVLDAGGAIRQWVHEGGRLLLNEIPGTGSLSWILPGYAVRREGNDTLAVRVEPVVRKHPLFRLLPQEALTTWREARGALAGSLILPVGPNLLAAAFPYSSSCPAAAVMEARLGKGGALVSQVEASSRLDHDGAATLWLHNLLSYFLGAAQAETAKELVKGPESQLLAAWQEVDPADCTPLDLSSRANRSFRDEVAGDGKGGWTDSGAQDFRHVPTGRQLYAGIPFSIIDPGPGGRNSCIMLKGARAPWLPAEVAGIPVERKLQRLFILHTAWYLKTGQALAEYVVRYADGSSTNIPVIGGDTLGDWYAPADLKNAVVAWSGRHPVVNASFGFYMTCWENPRPEQAITSLDFRSLGLSTPIVLALTGQEDREYSRDELGGAFSFSKGGYGFERIHDTRLRMARPHAWLGPDLQGKIVDAKTWRRLQLTCSATRPVRFKVLYISPSGDNGSSDWILPVTQEGGRSRYDARLDKVRWTHGSSPEAKEWGGRKQTVSTFGLDFYADEGTEVEVHELRLCKN